MESDIEEVFLSYANKPLALEPAHFYSIVAEAKRLIPVDLCGIEKPIRLICELSQFSDPYVFFAEINKRGSTNIYHDNFDEDLKVATYAIAGTRIDFYISEELQKKLGRPFDEERYGYEWDRCHDCDIKELVSQYIGEVACEAGFHQKCYNCFQGIFKGILKHICNGYKYSNISAFDELMFWSTEMSSRSTELDIFTEYNNTDLQEILSGRTFLTLSYSVFLSSMVGNTYNQLNYYILALASYSLTEFLIHNDRRKLKLCPYCENFFIATNIQRKRCYRPHCDKAYQRDKKRKQRDRNPIKYI